MFDWLLVDRGWRVHLHRRGLRGRTYGKTHRSHGKRETGRYSGWPPGPMHNREAVTHLLL